MEKTNKAFLILIFILTVSNFTNAQSNNADAIIGTWLMPDDAGKIKIYKENDNFNGRIVWFKETEKDGSPLKDKNNPIDSLTTRTIIGIKVMDNFKFKGNNLWDEGTFYAPQIGKITTPKCNLIDNNHLEIEISFLLFSKTIELTRDVSL